MRRGSRFNPRGTATRSSSPPNTTSFPAPHLLVKTNDFRPPEVAIAVDCAAADRMGKLEERVKKAKIVINIDHHPNTKFGAIKLIDESAASTSELVTQLLSRMGAEITPT